MGCRSVKSVRYSDVYTTTPGKELGQLYEQLESCKAAVAKDGIRFHVLTYQELICRLADELGEEHQEHWK